LSLIPHGAAGDFPIKVCHKPFLSAFASIKRAN